MRGVHPDSLSKTGRDVSQPANRCSPGRLLACSRAAHLRWNLSRHRRSLFLAARVSAERQSSRTVHSGEGWTADQLFSCRRARSSRDSRGRLQDRGEHNLQHYCQRVRYDRAYRDRSRCRSFLRPDRAVPARLSPGTIHKEILSVPGQPEGLLGARGGEAPDCPNESSGNCPSRKRRPRCATEAWMSAAPLNRIWNGTTGDDKHLRGMSDSAPLYALIILAGITGGVVCFIAAFSYLLLKIL